jgi:hypothetical protein
MPYTKKPLLHFGGNRRERRGFREKPGREVYYQCDTLRPGGIPSIVLYDWQQVKVQQEKEQKQ